MPLTASQRADLSRLVQSKPVVLFMKGNRHFPACGFSATVVGILKEHAAAYETVDVLQDPVVREQRLLACGVELSRLRDRGSRPLGVGAHVEEHDLAGVEHRLERGRRDRLHARPLVRVVDLEGGPARGLDEVDRDPVGARGRRARHTKHDAAAGRGDLHVARGLGREVQVALEAPVDLEAQNLARRRFGRRLGERLRSRRRDRHARA
jgi:hypothetical protein